MSNYTKATNFTTKDTLPTGNASKIVKGTELDTEFNAIASAISSKSNADSPTFTGTPLAPTATAGTNTTQVANTAFVTSAITDERTTSATLTNKILTAPFVTSILFEGTADDYETTLAFTDPTADRTITFPDKSGTVAMTSEITPSALSTYSGTYAIAGSSNLIVTATTHGRAIDDSVYLNITSGTAVDGYYTITAVTTNTFTVNYGSTITTSGNVTAYYSNKGTVAIASSDEVKAGTSTTKVVTVAAFAASTLKWNVTYSNTTVSPGSDFTIPANTILIFGYAFSTNNVVNNTLSSIRIKNGATTLTDINIGFTLGANNGNGYTGQIPFSVPISSAATTLTNNIVTGSGVPFYITGYVTNS